MISKKSVAFKTRMKVRLFRLIATIFVLLMALTANGQTESFVKGEFKVTQTEKAIGDIKIVISQRKSIRHIDPLCTAEIKIFKNGDLTDSLNISDDQFDAVGDRYGLLIYDELIKNHLILSKFGSYDGQTILINNKGQIFTTLGGFSYLDKKNGRLFSIYHSDISGFSVFDLNTDRELFSLTMNNDRVQEFYLLGDKYFMKTEQNSSRQEKIWEIDLEKQKLIESKIDRRFMINPLEELTDYKGMKIKCE
jgi:hypothetical protein